MPAKPEISVVVPAYNAERFVEPCLAPVLEQMTAAHELLVIDDGSRDRTAQLVDDIARRYPDAQVRLVRQQNQGIAGARNRGVDEARGDYLLFLDADDMLRPGTLAALGDVIREHAPDVIAFDFNMWRPDKPRKNHRVSLGYPAGAVTTDREAILTAYFTDRHTYVWAHVFRREIYASQAQPVFPPGRSYEDVAALAGLLADCRSLYRLEHAGIDYRQHPSSLKKAVSAKWCDDYVLALQHVKHAFERRPASDALRMQVDICACHFFIGMIKASFQLPWREGGEVRARACRAFAESLFHTPEQVLQAMERGALPSRDRQADRAAAAQARKALAGSLAFGIVKTVSRRIKQLQQAFASA
jgi:glycosyltransferase involved in cell wall biosynthesis